MSAEATSLIGEIARRLEAEPDIDDFLSWRGGTLEYWLQLVTTAVSRRHGWAAETEIPYITRSTNAGTEGHQKLADATAHIEDGRGLLFEVKTINIRQLRLEEKIRSTVDDMAALLATDWNATCMRSPTDHPDPQWWHRRSVMSPVNVCQLTLVHGNRPVGQSHVMELVRGQVDRRLSTLELDMPGQREPWLVEMLRAFSDPVAIEEVAGNDTAGVLIAWHGSVLSR